MSSDERSEESEWKHEVVAELADLVRERVDERKQRASGLEAEALDAAHSAIDEAEKRLKRKV